jgi:hypothetical protein
MSNRDHLPAKRYKRLAVGSGQIFAPREVNNRVMRDGSRKTAGLTGTEFRKMSQTQPSIVDGDVTHSGALPFVSVPDLGGAHGKGRRAEAFKPS